MVGMPTVAEGLAGRRGGGVADEGGGGVSGGGGGFAAFSAGGVGLRVPALGDECQISAQFSIHISGIGKIDEGSSIIVLAG